MNYFVTAINTGSGKTLVSAILCHALQADYWKPVQTGLEDRDVNTVKALVDNGHSLFFEESYLLKEPASPHQAAAMEGEVIDADKILIPLNNDNDLVIEGAGGALVPLNDEDYIIDLASKFDAEIIVVSNLYLGSINHTLLTINELKRRGLPIKGIVFNGKNNPYTKEIILKKTGLKELLHIEEESEINHEIVNRYAIKLFANWDA